MSLREQLYTSQVVKQIEEADELQMDAIIQAVIRRYNTLHTDREATFLSLSTDPQTRKKELDGVLALICACNP